MKKFLTASAIALMFGLGAGSAAHAVPVQTLSYAGDSVEVHQAGFKKFKHRRHFRSGGFKHRRFHRGKFNRGKAFDRRHRDHQANHGHNLHKKHNRSHGDGVVLKKKVISPFGFVFVK